jgi:hypothetical protein
MECMQIRGNPVERMVSKEVSRREIRCGHRSPAAVGWAFRKSVVRVATVLSIAVAIIAGCDASDDAPLTSGKVADTASRDVSNGPVVAVHAVQLGAFADSAGAVVLHDTLRDAGWVTLIRRGDSGGSPIWRVLVAPSTNSELPELIAHALRADGRDALVVSDSARIPVDVEVVRVNRGSHGMASRARWLLPPDQNSLLVVHDPVSTEAEALPDGFVFASESGPFLIQRDSVWDVTPSPEWNRLAWSRAFVMNAGRDETVPAAAWRRVAEAVNMSEDSIRRSAFMTSAMVPAYGFAQPLVIDLTEGILQGGTVERGRERALPVAGGWRLRWTTSGSVLAVGSPPERVQDNEPSRTFRGVDPVTGASTGPLDRASIAGVPWIMGPVMDISVRIDMRESRSLGTGSGSVESRGGWVRVDGRIVGPGLVLATTRNGRFVAAIVPRVNAGEYDAKTEVAVYQTRAR